LNFCTYQDIEDDKDTEKVLPARPVELIDINLPSNQEIVCERERECRCNGVIRKNVRDDRYFRGRLHVTPEEC